LTLISYLDTNAEQSKKVQNPDGKGTASLLIDVILIIYSQNEDIVILIIIHSAFV